MLQNKAIYLQWPTDSTCKWYVVYRMAPVWMTLNDPNQDFKVTPLFDAEYLRNDTRYKHSYNEIVTVTYTHPPHGVISNDLE